MKSKMKVYPLGDVAAALLQRKIEQKAWHFLQQFNCTWCGVKQTMGEPDILFKRGRCEECGKETDIEECGCNYMLYAGDAVHDVVSDMLLRTRKR